MVLQAGLPLGAPGLQGDVQPQLSNPCGRKASFPVVLIKISCAYP